MKQSMPFLHTYMRGGPHALFHAVQPSQSLHGTQTGDVHGHAAGLWACIVYTAQYLHSRHHAPTQGH